MKIFLSYKFTGEDPKKLTEFIQNICDSLKKAKHETLTTFWNKKEFEKAKATKKDIMKKSLTYIDNSNYYLGLIKSSEKSEGQLIELGYALARGRKIIIAIKKDIKMTWATEVANKIIIFKTEEELYKKLEKLKG